MFLGFRIGKKQKKTNPYRSEGPVFVINKVILHFVVRLFDFLSGKIIFLWNGWRYQHEFEIYTKYKGNTCMKLNLI